jgi:hypothetical protein
MSWILSMIICLSLTWGAAGFVIYKMIQNGKKNSSNP